MTLLNYDEEDSDNSSSGSSVEISFSAAKKLKKQRSQRGRSAASDKREDDQTLSKNKQKRTRRRSSARFLRLSCSANNNSELPLETESSTTREDVTSMYKTIMKLNNENKINAANSWGLKLIEHLDKVLEYDENVIEGSENNHNSSTNTNNISNEERGVNFTKASCTLDASIKIYSYRVDEVYLSSYKVLANLNRTDSSNASATTNGALDNHQDDEERATKRITKQSDKQRGMADTLETNLSNINMNKLDSAYDIDPLFHKMSKKFDEGGAKGLLLANLDIANDSCAIVFDSKDDNYSRDEKAAQANEPSLPVKLLDVSSLITNLRSLLNGASIRSIPLVPQLESLREEYKQLDTEGHIVSDVQLPRSDRYANSVEEEKEADRSIHLEAIERSRMSALNLTSRSSIDSGGRESGISYAPDDFGGGDDDDSDDGGYTNFLGIEEDCRTPLKTFSSPKVLPPPSMAALATTDFLDMICTTSDAIHLNNVGSSTFGLIDPVALEKFVSGNSWAGAAHWKKCSSARKKKIQKENVDSYVQLEEGKAPKSSKKKKKETSLKYVDLYSYNSEMDNLFEVPKKTKKSRNDPLQLTDATKKKNMKTNNCLPMDSSITIQDLTSLFGRPNAHIRPSRTSAGNVSTADLEDNAYNNNRRKTVAFYDTAMAFDNGGDDSYDDGPGFHFAGYDDASRVDDYTGASNFVERNVEGVRRIEKVSIGYAMVAKKVDVRNLKKNLWTELETHICINDENSNGQEESTETTPSSILSVQLERAATVPLEKSKVSFQGIVNTMDSKQTQADATVPFYFICLLHLANEKGLTLDSSGLGLDDFLIYMDKRDSSTIVTSPHVSTLDKIASTIASQKGQRSRAAASYTNFIGEDSDADTC